MRRLTALSILFSSLVSLRWCFDAKGMRVGHTVAARSSARGLRMAASASARTPGLNQCVFAGHLSDRLTVERVEFETFGGLLYWHEYQDFSRQLRTIELFHQPTHLFVSQTRMQDFCLDISLVARHHLKPGDNTGVLGNLRLPWSAFLTKIVNPNRCLGCVCRMWSISLYCSNARLLEERSRILNCLFRLRWACRRLW